MADLTLPDGFQFDDTPAVQSASSAGLPEGFQFDDTPTFNVPAAPQSGPSANALTDAERFIGTAANNAVAGLLSLPRAAAQGIDYAASWAGLHPGADSALSAMKDPTDPTKPAFPDFQQAKNLAFQTTGGTEYTPSTATGKMALAALSAAPLAVTNPTSLPGVIGGAATSELASEIFPNHPVLARLAGFIPGSWLSNRLAQTGSQLMGVATNAPQNKIAQAYQRQEVPTTLNGNLSQSPDLQFAQTFARRMPGGEDIIQQAQDAALTGFGNAIDRASARLGNAVTATQAGASLQNALNNWKQQQTAQNNQLWNQFHSLVPSNQRVDVSNYRQALSDLVPQPGNEQAAVAPISSNTAHNLLNGLNEAADQNGTLSWGTVRDIRTRVGGLLDSRPGTVDVDNGALKRLYGALSQDMQGAAAQTSPQAMTAFARANAATASFHDMLENGVGDVLNAPTPEQATQRALATARSGGSRVGATTLAAGPQASGDLAAYQLNRMAGNDGTDFTQASPTRFATATSGARPVLSPEARQVLFGDPQSAQDLQDLTTIGRSMQRTERAANSSGTAAHEARGVGRIMSAIELAKEGREIGGLPVGAAGFAAGMYMPNLLGRSAAFMATNPTIGRIAATNAPINFRQPGLLPRLLVGAQPPQQVGYQTPGLGALATTATNPQPTQ